MSNKVVCDKCNKKFEIKIKTRKLPQGIEEVYFSCPHCKEKYVSYYTDASIRKKQKAINKMWDEYKNCRTVNETVEKLEAIDKFKAEIKADMDNLKKKM